MHLTAKKMGHTEIQRFKGTLESYREEALDFLRRVEQERRGMDSDRSQDAGDLCVETSSREYLFERSSQQRQLVHRVERALRRIQSGTFGECIACGDGINRKRLNAMPWTEYCLSCQEEREQWAETSQAALYHVGWVK